MNFSKEMEQTRLNPGAELSLLPLALKAGSFRSSSASDAGPQCSSFLMWIVDVRGILASDATLHCNSVELHCLLQIELGHEVDEIIFIFEPA